MNKCLMIIIFILLTSCAAHGISDEPVINFDKSEKVSLKMVELFPEYTFHDEVRELLEITISSNIELFKTSLDNSTTLSASIGACDNGKHLPALAFNSVFLKRKTIEFYLMSNTQPELRENGGFKYQLYINFNKYKEGRYKDLKLCAKIKGSSYGTSFTSNIIELPLAQ
jgi:hypothetical protein